MPCCRFPSPSLHTSNQVQYSTFPYLISSLSSRCKYHQRQAPGLEPANAHSFRVDHTAPPPSSFCDLGWVLRYSQGHVLLHTHLRSWDRTLTLHLSTLSTCSHLSHPLPLQLFRCLIRIAIDLMIGYLFPSVLDEINLSSFEHREMIL